VRALLATLTFSLLTMAAGSVLAHPRDTGFLDRSVVVDGVSYRYQVYVPVDYSPKKRWPVVLFLHGSGERGEDGSVQAQAGIGSAIRSDRQRFPMIVVMPQARPNTRWSGAMAAQAMQALEKSITEFHGDRQRVYLTGLSMGGQGVWLLAAAHPHTFAALAPISSFLRLENDDDVTDPTVDRALLAQFPELRAKDPAAAMAQRIGKTPVWIFHGGNDDLVLPENARQMDRAMRNAGGEVRYSEYAGVNHGAWDRAYAEPELIPWLLSHHLEKQRND
jgi:predicted peptidase